MYISQVKYNVGKYQCKNMTNAYVKKRGQQYEIHTYVGEREQYYERYKVRKRGRNIKKKGNKIQQTVGSFVYGSLATSTLCSEYCVIGRLFKFTSNAIFRDKLPVQINNRKHISIYILYNEFSQHIKKIIKQKSFYRTYFKHDVMGNANFASIVSSST